MPHIFDQLVSYDNLFWAWEKVKRYYDSVDTWFDEIRVSAFESRLQNELYSIASDLKAGRYHTRPLKLLPQPKKPGRDGKPQVRQAFLVDVRDQVATVAYVNVIGGDLDEKMPIWSYGNRLFRSLRRIDDGSFGRTNIGPYRNSSGEIYRRWGQSWPLFKRHIVLSLRKMCGRRAGLEDDAERAVLEREQTLRDKYRLPYLKETFWTRYTEHPVWCSLDIEKFYPSVSLELVRKQILKHSDVASEIGSEALKALTTFSLDLSGWLPNHLSSVQIMWDADKQVRIPTGLMVAGFLANVAMLDVDTWVSDQILDRQVAHFRYVDDHVILAPDLDALVNWAHVYIDRLTADTGCKINIEKVEPEGLVPLLKRNAKKRPPEPELLENIQLDPEFPTPLMTKTLAKVSDIARTNFDLLTEEGQRRFLDDLEHLLLAPLPETELAIKTRVTFAATRIARLAPRQERGEDQYFAAWNKALELERAVRELDGRLQTLRPDCEEAKKVRTIRKRKRAEQRAAVITLNQEQQKIGQAREADMTRTFKVLSKALREQYDKLRLWQRILDFGRFSGVNHVAAVASEIDRVEPPLAGVLIRAKVLQLHAHNVLSCVATVIDEKRTHSSRRAALEYLRDILRPPNFRVLTTRSGRFYYERLSCDLLVYALHLCLQIIERFPILNEPVLNREWQDVRHLAKAVKKLRLPRGDGYLWWREKLLYRLDIELISSRRITSKLNPKDPASWLIWECRPQQVPLAALGTLLAGKISIGPGDGGWLRDLIAARSGSNRRKFIAALKPSRGTIARRAIDSARETHTLFEWAQFTINLRDFDPRSSEWTVLEICRQLCILLQNKNLDAQTRLIFASHASNFRVPRAWWNSGSKFGWKEWEDMCTSRPLERAETPIADYRVAAALGIFLESPTEFSLVRAIGSIMAGLLRCDFVWPMPWRVIGVQATLRGSVEAYLQNRPCSSRTLAILEAVLLARPYESWLIGERKTEDVGLADDTAADPPSIVSVNDLRLAIEKSMKTLAGYRLTITELEPRQLIPIRVAQFTKENWDREDDGGDELDG